MANNIIRIDPTKVNKAGRTIVEEGNKMYNALEGIKDIVNNTKKCLRSDGGDAARANFNSSAAKFDEFKNFIHDYGEFLQNYGKSHVDLDNEVSNLAKKIQKL